MEVVFFHRKRFPGNFSIESLFEQIRSALPQTISCSVKELSFHSNGFFKRLYISFEAAFSQKDINHVTGDVHFISLFLKRKRTILTIHDLGFMNHPNRLARMILKWFWLVLPVRSCAAITVVSEATKSDVLKWVGRRHESRIHVIYNPVKKGFVKMEKTFNATEPVILQIGTRYNKNLIRLIQALSGISCKLLIVGEVPVATTAELVSHAIKYETFKNLTDQELLEKYRVSDIVTFVSTHEGFGLPIIESNTIGRVVVTSNISSMPEVAGNAAYLVDPFDVMSIRNGILRVIHDASHRQNLIENGYENGKRFDLTKIAKQYESLYVSLQN